MVYARTAALEAASQGGTMAKGASRAPPSNMPNGASGAFPSPNGAERQEEDAKAAMSKTPENGHDVPATANGTSAQASEKDEQRQKEDDLVNKGKEIAKVRALLCRGFSPPAPEPARPKSQWAVLLDEVAWLASDFSQERLWKKSVALALSYDIAKKKGEFKLNTPPSDPDWEAHGKSGPDHWQKYSKEIAELRKLASTPQMSHHGTGRAGRHSARALKAAAAAEASGNPAMFLSLDPSTDPVFADLQAPAEEGMVPGTPPLEELTLELTVGIDDYGAFANGMHECLTKAEVDRFVREEAALRSYRMEYEAALASHQLAVAEQQRDAQMITGLEGLFPGYETDGFATERRSTRRRRSEGRAGTAFAGELEDEYGARSGRAAAKASNVEDVYLKKKKPRRIQQSYPRDMDIEYDVGVDGMIGTAGGRTTRLQRRRQMSEAIKNRQGKAQGGVGYQQHLQQQHGRRGPVPGVMTWTKAEDELLLAVVHEFGINWQLVSEVLNLSLSLLGIYRPGPQCRQRFRQLCVNQESQGVDSDERAYQALLQRIEKQSARELLAKSLPVRDDALIRLLEVIAQVGSSARGRRMQEESRNEALRKQQQPPNASYNTLVNNLLSQTGGRRLNPLELAERVNDAYLQQARQQQMLAAAQAAAAAQQQMSGAGKLQQPLGNPGGDAAGTSAAATNAAPAATPAAGFPAAGTVQPPSTNTAASTPVGGVGLDTAAAAAPMTINQLQVSVQQLQNILQSGQINGRDLTDEMRRAVEAQKASYLGQIQQLQQQQQQQQQAVNPAVTGSTPAAPGGAGAMPAAAAFGTTTASVATFAAMQAQAQQQAAAAAAAAMQSHRPSVLPAGIYGVGGSPHSPQMGVALPPATGMALPTSGAMGSSLPPAAQQQLVMQQMMAQQQAAAAAAVAQQQQPQ